MNFYNSLTKTYTQNKKGQNLCQILIFNTIGEKNYLSKKLIDFKSKVGRPKFFIVPSIDILILNLQTNFRNEKLYSTRTSMCLVHKNNCAN